MEYDDTARDTIIKKEARVSQIEQVKYRMTQQTSYADGAFPSDGGLPGLLT